MICDVEEHEFSIFEGVSCVIAGMPACQRINVLIPNSCVVCVLVETILLSCSEDIICPSPEITMFPSLSLLVS